MIRSVVPFRHWHLEWLKLRGLAEGGAFELGNEVAMALERHFSWTAVVDGEAVACGGTVQIWPGRHSAWAYLTKRAGPHMRFITRSAFDTLAKVKGRIEVTVRCDFEAGHRWAKMLGFELETLVMPAYGPEGEAHTSYVRFN